MLYSNKKRVDEICKEIKNKEWHLELAKSINEIEDRSHFIKELEQQLALLHQELKEL